jgi:hypothetical protein
MTSPKTSAGYSEEEKSMRISRFRVISAAVLLLVAFSVGLRGQDQKSPNQEERLKAITLVRTINTAEVRYSAEISKGRFASWTELFSSGVLKDLHVSPGSEIIPGYHLDLLASADGKSFLVALHDTRDGDGLFSVFSDQTGILFLGAPPQ